MPVNVETAAMVSGPARTFDRLPTGNLELLMDPYLQLLVATGQLYIAAWKLSGIDSKQQELLMTLPSYWQ